MLYKYIGKASAVHSGGRGWVCVCVCVCGGGGGGGGACCVIERI